MQSSQQKYTWDLKIILTLQQVHIRDLPAYVDCRHQLLLLKPSSKPNWLSFAISAHLVGDLPKALSALTAFQATQEDIAPSERLSLLCISHVILV